MSETVRLNMKNLDRIIKALSVKPPKIRIGIIGDSPNQRADGGPTNAEIGAIHEFGKSDFPVRSFLRVPLATELKPALERDGILTKETMKQILLTGSIMPLFQRIAIVAEGVVYRAFDTGGYGKWVPSNMGPKKNHQTLVETSQLRDSILSEVIS